MTNPYKDPTLRVAWFRGFATGHTWADDHRPGTLLAGEPPPVGGVDYDLSRRPVRALMRASTEGINAGRVHYDEHGFDERAYREATKGGVAQGLLAARAPNPARGCLVCKRPIAGRADRVTCSTKCRKALSRQRVVGGPDMPSFGPIQLAHRAA